MLIDSGRAGGRKSVMDTILIMAKALAKATSLDILRLDIQYNRIYDQMSALCVLGESIYMDTDAEYITNGLEYIINEDGTVAIRENVDPVPKYVKEVK